MMRPIQKFSKKLFWLGVVFLCHSLSAVGQYYFTPNEGQCEGEFLYSAKFGNTAFFLAEDHMGFTQVSFADDSHSEDDHVHGEIVGGHHYRMYFLNAEVPVVRSEGESPYKENFFVGPRSRWRSNVQPVESVTLEGLYPGVDLYVYSRYGQLKYDLLVDDVANLNDVKIYYDGAEQVELINERIHVTTSVGEVIEIRPYAYVPESKKAIEARYVLTGDTLSFDIDPNYVGPLTLDPTFVFSTFTGSQQDNWGYSATYHPVDSTVFAAGIGTVIGGNPSSPLRYPLTTGAFDTIFQGATEVAISKFSADGKQMLYSTYLGGVSVEQPNSIVCDSLGRLAILGTTSSIDFPTTLTGYDTTHNGGSAVTPNSMNYFSGSDVFVSVLSPNGDALVGSTFMGGTGTDGLNMNMARNYGDQNRGEIIISPSNTIMVVTNTDSDDIPLVNAFQSARVGQQEAWAFELPINCDTVLWSTYYGGTGDETGFSIRAFGNAVFICGASSSSVLLGSANGVNPSNAGGRDGYVARFSGPNRAVQTATFNGTSGMEMNFLMDVRTNGDVYVLGQTNSVYPTSNGAINESNASIYVQEFNELLTQEKRSLTFGNKLANSTAIAPTAFAVDQCGDMYLSGWGGSTNNIPSTTRNMYVSSDAYQDTTDGSDLYFAVIDASFSKFNYATFFGGLGRSEHVDGGTSRFDSRGVMYQAICADCGTSGPKHNYPTFPVDVYSHVNGAANCNLAVTVIAFEQQEANVQAQAPDTVCSPFNLVMNTSVSGADYLIWDFGGGDVDTTFNVPSRLYDVPGQYSVTLIALDTNCLTSDTAVITFEVVDPQVTADFQLVYDPCDDTRLVQFNPDLTDGVFYWDFGDGRQDTSVGPIQHQYASDGPFTVTLIATASNCFGSSVDTLSQDLEFKAAPPTPVINFYYNGCANSGEARLSCFTPGWHIYEWDLSDGQSFIGDYVTLNVATGFLTVTLTVTDTICNRSFTVSETFEVSEETAVLGENMPNVFTPNGDGVSDYFQFNEGFVPTSLSRFSIKIYDRWGKLLWEGNTASFKWPGTVDGKPLAEGVYFWVIDANSDCGASVEEHGTVHIFK